MCFAQFRLPNALLPLPQQLLPTACSGRSLDRQALPLPHALADLKVGHHICY